MEPELNKDSHVGADSRSNATNIDAVHQFVNCIFSQNFSLSYIGAETRSDEGVSEYDAVRHFVRVGVRLPDFSGLKRNIWNFQNGNSRKQCLAVVKEIRIYPASTTSIWVVKHVAYCRK